MKAGVTRAEHAHRFLPVRRDVAGRKMPGLVIKGVMNQLNFRNDH